MKLFPYTTFTTALFFFLFFGLLAWKDPLQLAKAVMPFYTYPSVYGGIDVFDARSFGIVNFHQDELKATFKYDFDNNIDIAQWSPGDQQYMQTRGMIMKAFHLGCIFFFDATYQRDVVYGFYDSYSGECGKIGGIFTGGGFTDDLDGGPPFLPEMIAAAGIAYDFISPAEYKQLLANHLRAGIQQNAELTEVQDY